MGGECAGVMMKIGQRIHNHSRAFEKLSLAGLSVLGRVLRSRSESRLRSAEGISLSQTWPTQLKVFSFLS